MTSSDAGAGPRCAPLYVLAAGVAVFIAYGSLYPFAFHGEGSLRADIVQFLASWRHPSTSPGDVLANLVLYLPLGWSATLAFEQSFSRLSAAFLTLLCGASLSLAVELAQFYDLTRVSALSDFFLNVVGLLLGTMAARTGGRLRLSWPPGGTPGFARLLLLAWLAGGLFPYAPTLEIHHYWRALRPVLFAPPIDPFEVFHHTVLWLSVAFVFRIGVGRSFGLFVLAMLAFFAAKASIVGQLVLLPDLLGAAIALLALPLLARRFGSVSLRLMAAMLLLLVILTRVLPWQLAPTPRPFQWIPFYSFLHGSNSINAVSFAEKFYLYGATLLLLVRAGLGLWLAVALECIILFACGLLQTHMMGGSAEISDAIMALILGLIYVLLRHRHREAEKLSLRDVPAESAN